MLYNRLYNLFTVYFTCGISMLKSCDTSICITMLVVVFSVEKLWQFNISILVLQINILWQFNYGHKWPAAIPVVAKIGTWITEEIKFKSQGTYTYK